MQNAKTSWSEFDDEFLINNVDKMSQKAIGNHLGRSRAAIVGRINRLGLRKHNQSKTAGTMPRKLAPPNSDGTISRRMGRPSVPRLQPTYKDSKHIPLLDIKDGQCRFPDADTSGVTLCYCGLPVVNLNSNVNSKKYYCHHHEQVMKHVK